ncbi:MAG: sigma-70 family RNA polymerase sigma factor [Spirochaetes bacterium]|nr:sigma-70 family RNA polymerase sigma factor [Spirochaetota bacterium]
MFQPDEKSEDVFVNELLAASGALHHWLSAKLADQHTVEDLVQETLLQAWQSRQNFRQASSVSTWLHAIAKHLLWHQYRSSQTRNRYCCPLAPQIADPLSSDESSSSRYNQLSLELALNDLSRADRWLYQEFYQARRTIRQLAKETGQPEGTIKYRLFQLRRRLYNSSNGGRI